MPANAGWRVKRRSKSPSGLNDFSILCLVSWTRRALASWGLPDLTK